MFRICEYPIYYLIGFWFEESGVRKKCFEIDNSVKWSRTIGGVILSVFLLLGTKLVEQESLMLQNVFWVIQALIGTYAMFMLSAGICTSTFVESGGYKLLLEHNFAIYLYHEPLQFLMLWILANLGGLSAFNSNVGYLILIAIRFAVSILGSLAIEFAVAEIKDVRIWRLIDSWKRKKM